MEPTDLMRSIYLPLSKGTIGECHRLVLSDARECEGALK